MMLGKEELWMLWRQFKKEWFVGGSQGIGGIRPKGICFQQQLYLHVIVYHYQEFLFYSSTEMQF